VNTGWGEHFPYLAIFVKLRVKRVESVE
jgi:hypothetical protein